METDSIWSFERLRVLVDPSTIPRLGIFTSSLQQKFRFCDYHGNRCKELFQDFHTPSIETHSLLGPEMENLFFEFEGHFIAFMCIFHSTPDTFAQIANIVILNSRLSENDVSFKSVRVALEKQGNKELASGFAAFLELQQFKYFDGFVNTMKHRHLLKPAYSIVVNEKEGALIDFKFEAFEYYGSIFPERGAHEIIGMRDALGIEMVRIGCGMNEFLEKSSRGGGFES